MSAADDVAMYPHLQYRYPLKCNFLLHQVAVAASWIEDPRVTEDA